MESIHYLLNGVFALLGAMVGGYFTSKAADKAHKHQQALSQEIETKKIQGLLQAIHDEMETVYGRYQETMGLEVENLNETAPLLIYYPITEDYFTVYNGNATLIGRIPDNNIRKKIVKTYTLGKGFIDSFRMNNALVRQLEHWQGEYLRKQNLDHQSMVAQHEKQLIDYAKDIKKSHHELKEAVNDLLQALVTAGVHGGQKTNKNSDNI